MKIIIVGNGKVGFAIAGDMAKENHDIIMVDSAAPALQRADSSLDVMCVEGNGASISVLIEAGARNADLVIAVTDKDETNLVCCLIAKKLGARHTIARVRNPEYRRDAETLKQEIGLDMVINPDLSAAMEIARILSFPMALSVEPFARGRIDMIGIRVEEQDTLVGKTLSSLGVPRLAKVLVCAAEHGGELLIPDGSFAPAVGDKLYLIGAKPELQKTLQGLGRAQQRIKTASLMGGSRTAVYLAWELASAGTKVRLVELSHSKCQRLAEQLPHAMIIQGDGTDSALLQAENIFDSDAFISLTDRDEENLLIAMNAQRMGVSKVIAKMTRPNYIELAREMGVGSVISPKDITAGQITRYVRALANSEGSAVESLYRMLDGTVEALEFQATAASAPVLNRPLKDLPSRHGVLVAAIARGQDIIIPGGMTEIREGDRVVVVSKAIGLKDLRDILA